MKWLLIPASPIVGGLIGFAAFGTLLMASISGLLFTMLYLCACD